MSDPKPANPLERLLFLYLPTTEVAAKLFKKTRGGGVPPQWFEREPKKGVTITTWAPCGEFHAAYEVARPHALVLADPDDAIAGEYGRFVASNLYSDDTTIEFNLTIGSPEMRFLGENLVASFGGRLLYVDPVTKKEVVP